MCSLHSPVAHAGNMFSPSIAGTSSSHGHQPAEVFRKDLISAMKLPDSYQLQADEYMVIQDTWKQDWEKGVQVPVNPDSIPLVDCTSAKDPEVYSFKMPRRLICTSDGTLEQDDYAAALNKKLESVCLYDLDEVDEQWLELVNQEREEMNDPPIDEFTMERIIEECELQCHKNMEHAMQTEEGLGIEYDDDVICDVCRAPDCEEGNEMVFCDKCDICVHQACYGIVKVPEGSWMCRTCALGLQPMCLLCGKKGGAMKSTRSGTKWAHVSCALWIPEVSIGCVERMEPITKISQIPGSRWALICNLCRLRTGACIQCSVKTCKVAYHVTCGFQNNLEMKTFLDEEVEVRFKSFCLKHSKKRNAESESEGTPQKTSSPAAGTPKKEKSLEEKDNERAIRIQNITEDFYKYAKAKDVACNLNMKDDNEMVDFVFEYWKLKRKSGFNKPLVILQKEESPSDNEEYNLHARMRMFVHLRQDLERVRNLCYMVQKREKLSRQMSTLREDIFRKQQQIFSGDLSQFTQEDLDFAKQAVALSSLVPEKMDSTFDLFSDVSVEDKVNEKVMLVEDIVTRDDARSRTRTESECSSSSETESYSDSRSSSRADLSKMSEDQKPSEINPSLQFQIPEKNIKRTVVVESQDITLPRQKYEIKRSVTPPSKTHEPSVNHSVKSDSLKQTSHQKRTSSDADLGDSIQSKRKSRNGRYNHSTQVKSKVSSGLKSAGSDSSHKPHPLRTGGSQVSSRPLARHSRHTLSPRQLQMKQEAERVTEQMFASSPASRAILSGYRIPKKKSIPSNEVSPPASEADTAPLPSPQRSRSDEHMPGITPETRSVRRRLGDELHRDSNRQFESIDSEVSICSHPRPSLCDSEDDIIIVDDDHQEQVTKQLLSRNLSSSASKLTRSQSVDSSDVNNRVPETKPVISRIYDAAYRLLSSSVPP